MLKRDKRKRPATPETLANLALGRGKSTGRKTLPDDQKRLTRQIGMNHAEYAACLEWLAAHRGK